LTDLALSVIDALGAKPTEPELARIRRDPTTNTTALERAAAGLKAQRAGNRDQARAMFEKALAADPKFAEMHAAAAGIFLEIGKPEQATERMQAYTAARPDDPGARTVYALTLLAANRVPDAIAQAEEARRLWPNKPDTAFLLAHLISVTGDHERALKICNEALSAPGFDAANFDPEIMLIPFASRMSLSPSPMVFASRLPKEALAALMRAGGELPAGLEAVVVGAMFADQITMLIGLEGAPLPDARWAHDHAKLVIDGRTELRPNLMGLVFAGFDQESKAGQPADMLPICFDAMANGAPTVPQDAKTLTLVIDDLAGARREFTWQRPAVAEECFLQLLTPLLAKSQPAPTPSNQGDAFGAALLSALRIDAHGEAPLAALWLPPYFADILKTMLGAAPQAVPPGTLEQITEECQRNLFFLLLSPTLGEFKALPLDEAAAGAKLAIDGGADLAPRKVDVPLIQQMLDGMSSGGRNTVKLVAFPTPGTDSARALSQSAKRIKLTVTGFAGAPARAFTWDLPPKIPDELRALLGE
jgi:hypothetical protein